MKYQRFTPTGCRDIEIQKFDFVAKTQFFYFSSLKIDHVDVWFKCQKTFNFIQYSEYIKVNVIRDNPYFKGAIEKNKKIISDIKPNINNFA